MSQQEEHRCVSVSVISLKYYSENINRVGRNNSFDVVIEVSMLANWPRPIPVLQ